MTKKSNTILPEVPRSIEEPPARKFVPDYKYASPEVIKSITVAQLAKLEGELHTLRIIFFAQGENPEVLVAQNRTLGQEIESVTAALDRLSQYFEAALSEED